LTLGRDLQSWGSIRVLLPDGDRGFAPGSIDIDDRVIGTIDLIYPMIQSTCLRYQRDSKTGEDQEVFDMKGLTTLLVAVFTLAVSASLGFAQGGEVAPAGEDLSRPEARQEAREGKQDARGEGREGRQDARGEGPDARHDARQDAREGREDARESGREGRRTAR
jgi:hypothetical protein